MVSFTAEAIILAVHSAIRLSAGLRKAYANNLKTKALVLPLPPYEGNPNLTTAGRFFKKDGKEFVNKVAYLQELNDEFAQNRDLPAAKAADYLAYYKAYFQSLNGNWEGMAATDLNHLLVIKQWETGKSKVTRPLQLVAGTLVEIGVDFFAQVPGAVHQNSVVGKFLYAFLNGIDQVDFSESEDLKKTVVQKVVPQLFVASAETLNKLSDEITDDPKLQNFIAATSQSLTDDLYQRIKTVPTGKEEEVIQWGQLILRSMVRNATSYVFSNPNEAIGTGQKESELVKTVGQTLMSILLDEDPNAPINFKEVFTARTLDAVVRSALTVVAQHPSLLSNKNGLKEIIAGIAAALAESGINRPALLPELIQLVMLQTAGNLERLLDTQAGEPKHLLVTALRPILTILAPKDIFAKWQPTLTNTNILEIVNAVFDEVVRHPEWLTSTVAEETLLSEVLKATYGALATIPEDNRLTGKTLAFLIQLNLRVAAENKAVLAHLKWGDGEQESTILNHALNLIFAFVFEQTTVLNKVNLLFELINYVMDVLVLKHPNQNGLLLTQLILKAEAGVIKEDGLDQETANSLVKAALEIISENPNLIAKQAGLANLISGVANAFKNSGFEHPNLLPELLRITLEKTGGNVNQLIPSQSGEPTYLLVLALEEILRVLSQPVPDGKWKPSFSNAELVLLVEMLLDEVVHNPSWILEETADQPLLSAVLEANFGALREIPSHQRINATVLQALMQLSLQTAAANTEVLKLIKWGSGEQERSILRKALDLIFTFVFKETNQQNPAVLLLELVDYVLSMLLAKHPNEQGLTLTLILLSDEVGLLLTQNGFNQVKADELIDTALLAIAQHPELVSQKVGIQNIVNDTVKTLLKEDLPLDGLLLEMLRLILEKTAGNLELLVDTRRRKQKFILLLALQQILKAICQSPASGKWKPRLTNQQIREVTRVVFDHLIQNPSLVKNEFVFLLIKGLYKSLENVPKSKPVPYLVFQSMLTDALAAVNFRKQLLVEVFTNEKGKQQLAIHYSLDGLFIALYDQSGGTVGTWTLTQSPALEAIVHAFLTGISRKSIQKAEIDEAIGLVKAAVHDLNKNKDFLLEDLLKKL